MEQDSVQASLKKQSSASNKSQPATVELYFAKKMNPEKKALRVCIYTCTCMYLHKLDYVYVHVYIYTYMLPQHLLRKASTEAKAYGTLTYKQLNPAQKEVHI